MEIVSPAIEALRAGVPVLALHFLVTITLFVAGITFQMFSTPYREFALIKENNTAAGIVFFGAVIALAIPLQSTLAGSLAVMDIVVWGSVAVLIQVVVSFLVRIFVRTMAAEITRNNVAMGLKLAAIQIGVGMLNAGAMAG